MKPSTKFAIGALLIVGSVGAMIAEGIKNTGTYFLTPTQLITRTSSDPGFHDVSIKVSAKVVRGSVHRDPEHQRFDFAITDSVSNVPVTYVGLMPDTFTDANDIDVVVEGKYGRDGTFHATDVLAKCGSRYDAVVAEQGKKS